MKDKILGWRGKNLQDTLIIGHGISGVNKRAMGRGVVERSARVAHSLRSTNPMAGRIKQEIVS